MIGSEDYRPIQGQGETRMKPKSIHSAARLALGALSVGILAACGGAGGGGGGFDVADGGIRGTGSSVGPVSGFGSVYLNGIEFATDEIPNKSVQSNDGIVTESDLSEGMIIRIEGQWRDNGQGTAEELEYDDTLRGPVDSVTADPSGGGEFVTVVVMGQSVRVDRQTVVRGLSFADLLGGSGVGDHVRVSAWRQADGSYRAGYLGIIPSNLTDVELEGSVSAVDTASDSFSIGTITVEYDEGSVIFGSGLTENDLEDVATLEAEGRLENNTIYASTIDRGDSRRYRRNDADDFEVTATIDSPYAQSGAASRPGEFTLGDLSIQVTSSTELDDGLTLEDLQQGLLVQVEGRFLSDTVVEADEIARREANASVQGVIASAADDRLYIGGVEVRVTPNTVFTKDDDGEVTFASLPIGNVTVEVEGIESQQGTDVFISALNVEVDDELASSEKLDEFELEGQLRGISAKPGTISLLGVQMSDGDADYGSRSDLVTDFEAGQTIRLEVDYAGSNGGFVADEIERDDLD
jgi:hypothetical protein